MFYVMECCFCILKSCVISAVYRVGIMCTMCDGKPLRKDYLNITNRVNETATRITVTDKEDKTLSTILTADIDLEE